jgi:ATP-dependent RNA helicase DDX23/PRP28
LEQTSNHKQHYPKSKSPSLITDLLGNSFIHYYSFVICFYINTTFVTMSTKDDDPPLIDPSLLAKLSESERAEALAAAAAAKRAEERAEERALQRALEKKRQERLQERESELEKARLKKRGLGGGVSSGTDGNGHGNENGEEGSNKLVFVPKKRRGLKQNGNAIQGSKSESSSSSSPYTNNTSRSATNNGHQKPQHQQGRLKHHLSESEMNAIKKAYLGESAVIDEEKVRRQELQRQKRARQKKKITFKFEWDGTDDTSNINGDHGVPHMMPLHKSKRQRSRDKPHYATNTNVMTKPIQKMTARDWRIFKENYDISVKGGKSPPPLRNFRESSTPDVPPIHPTLIRAIERVLKYKEPSPIQRQAIPIGLQRRDLIGVAETGSGKTAAFGIPLCHHILTLPQTILSSVDENGPLALVMAPTRELAQQIDAEIVKILSLQSNIKTTCIVGGQAIQNQAMTLRNGVHIVVGTPGRINDCIENAYLVLNQCSYIVLDEADRMIDLGFAPQIELILDAMSAVLKSENAEEAYEQEVNDLKNLKERVPKYRLTAMFSATMPAEVQRMSKKYLRHPAVVSIGDGADGGGKNQRIEQRVLFLSSPAMKEKALKDVIANKTTYHDKVIVFVNEKKHCDGVGRMVERIGRRCVVLHGGKSQEQREENLELFRRGGVVLVATDVAGRGLDIPNIKHVVSFIMQLTLGLLFQFSSYSSLCYFSLPFSLNLFYYTTI